jgi:outer membrane cobalamin receptor
MTGYTDEQIRVGGGITGNVSGFNMYAEAFYSYINDMALFVNDTSVTFQNRFKVIYDDISLLQIRGGVDFLKLKQLRARLSATYYQYIPKEEDKAWHMPDFEIELDARYTLKEAYTFRFFMLVLGSKYAPDYVNSTMEENKIKGALDLGFGFDYRINRMFTAFAEANNLLNQNYQRWYQYPVQGIMGMVGVKMSF